MGYARRVEYQREFMKIEWKIPQRRAALFKGYRGTNDFKIYSYLKINSAE